MAATGLLTPAPAAPPAFPGWPNRWVQLVEEIPLADFPGRIGRFQTSDGPLLLRRIARPSRLLHSTADCLRAAGRSPVAREAIFDADGRCYEDVSQWFWAATLGQSRGPWMAETRLSP